MNESVRGPIDHAKKSQTNGRTITTGASSSNPVGEPSAPMPHASAKNQRGGYDRTRKRVPPFEQVGPGEQESYRRYPPEDDVISAPGVEKAPGRPRDPRSPRFSDPVCDQHLSSARERPTMNHRFGERHHVGQRRDPADVAARQVGDAPVRKNIRRRLVDPPSDARRRQLTPLLREHQHHADATTWIDAVDSAGIIGGRAPPLTSNPLLKTTTVNHRTDRHRVQATPPLPGRSTYQHCTQTGPYFARVQKA